MNQVDCGALQDRMPDVAAGTAQWTAEEVAHLSRCESCAAEWQIVETARRLGGSAARQVDPAKLAVKVLAEVRARDKRARWIRAGWMSGLVAAGIVVVLLAGPNQTPGPIRQAAEPLSREALPLAELSPLDADQLEAILEQLEPEARETGSWIPSMGDLDDQQLERVLRSLEG